MGDVLARLVELILRVSAGTSEIRTAPVARTSTPCTSGLSDCGLGEVFFPVGVVGYGENELALATLMCKAVRVSLASNMLAEKGVVPSPSHQNIGIVR